MLPMHCIVHNIICMRLIERRFPVDLVFSGGVPYKNKLLG